MLRPARMVHFNVLVFDSEVDRITTEMIRRGLFHLSSIADLEPWAEEEGLQTAPEERAQEVSEIESSARAIAEKLAIRPEIVSEAQAFAPFDPTEAKETVEAMDREVREVVGARAAARENLADLKEAKTQLARDIWAKLGVDVRSRYTLLRLVVGRLPEKNLVPFKRFLSQIPNVVMTFPEERGTIAVMVIVLRRDQDKLRRAMDEVGLEEMRVPEEKPPLSEAMTAHLDERIEEAEEKVRKAEEAVADCRNKYFPTLQAILSKISLQRLKREARSRFRKTARTYLLSGWTPRDRRDEVIKQFREVSGNRCLIEEQSADEVLSQHRGKADVPVLLENPKMLKPFEALVENYGRPTYNSIDPTAVMAPTFLLMFGLMFGDVGQGLVIALLATLVARSKRVSEGIRQIAKLLVWAGGSATLFGFLYGSVFGFTSLLPYRGYEPMQNIGSFLTIALIFGVAMMSLGMAFNIVGAIWRKDWAAGLLDWSGLMGLAFYWALVLAAILFLSGRRVSGMVVGVLIGLPLAATSLKVLVEKRSRGAAERASHGGGGFVGETLESWLAFLTNTLSHVRLAAFALAHAALFEAVFAIAGMLRGVPGLPVLAHILGNAVIIGLEGLVVSVQTLRLHYYEFFARFFQAGGTEFKPVRLRGAVP
jgi:V/A-type H+-transporting ATPase subunit I